MKTFYKIACLVVIAVSVMACGEQKSKGTKFAPQERTSSLSDMDKKKAIEQKRAEYNLDMEDLLNSKGVKISIVLPKALGDDITENLAERISFRLLHIAGQNGINALGINPSFVLGTEMMQTGKATTGTAPQKMTVQYELAYKVYNIHTGDIYGAATEQITGVGNSFEEANLNAVKEIKNTPALKLMLKTATENISEWYENNLSVLQSQIEMALNKEDYALALAMVESVPQTSSKAFEYATKVHADIYAKLKKQNSKESLVAMTAAIAEIGDDFDPKIAAYLSMIPADTPEYSQANKMFDAYKLKCDARRSVLEKKAEKDAEAARAFEQEKMKIEQEEKLVQIEADKMKYKYLQMANAKAMEKAMRYESDKKKGFWGKLGDRILGGIDAVGDGISDIEWN